jgi:hypothetical protein
MNYFIVIVIIIIIIIIIIFKPTCRYKLALSVSSNFQCLLQTTKKCQTLELKLVEKDQSLNKALMEVNNGHIQGLLNSVDLNQFRPYLF